MAEERKQKVNADVAAPTPAGLWKKASIALLVLAVFGGAYYVGYHKRTHKYDAFARCLKDRQVKMYGAYWCPHCAEQKEMFGESFEFAPYIECGVAGDRRAEQPVCKEAGIQHFPTWQFPPTGERVEAVMPFADLSSRTGCPLP
jgi:hypothetical protein